MKASDFKRLAVVSVASGAKLGNVDDLLFDTQPLRVAALRVKSDTQEMVVRWDAVKSIGPDAVMVPEDAAAHTTASESSIAALPTIEALHELKVVNESGAYLGRIREVEIDPASGQVTQVEVHEGGVLGLGGTTTDVTAAEIHSIGEQILVASVPARS